MKVQSTVRPLLLALLVISCGGRQAVEIDPNTVPVQNRWNGTVASPPELGGIVAIRGSGWMGPHEEDTGRTQAQVSISNAVPGGEHPWHVHRGRCGSDQGIFGPADAYKPLKVGGNGRASSTAELPVPSPRTGQFFINIHASARNMATIVACGNLAPPSR
ncbi:MAG TPA: hypothetical protein VJ808_11430 [Gemmatimonadales bacterium]|nr:hypothetical protein [Gemmatimonadales bacterium]